MAINNRYVEFESSAPFTLKLSVDKKTWDGSIHVSFNDFYSSYYTWTGNPISSYPRQGKFIIQLRGYHNSRLVTDAYQGWQLISSSDAPIHCYGYVDTLLDYTLSQSNKTALERAMNGAFQGLFKDNVNLVDSLQMITAQVPLAISSGCFYLMYSGCTGLLNSMSIHTRNLGSGACAQMYSGCTSLVTAGDIDAVEVKTGSCYRMFYGCTSLIKPPVLYPTRIESSSYSQMFEGCSHLEELVLLPSDALSSECYSDMFHGCSKIQLSSSKTSSYKNSYRIPFTKSSSSTSSSFVNNMFVNTGGSFKGTPDINKLYYTSNELVNTSFTTLFYRNKDVEDLYNISLTQHIADYINAVSFSRTGYTFTGWFTDRVQGDEYSTDTQLRSEIPELYAHWQAKQYNINLDSNKADEHGTTAVTAIYDSYLPQIILPVRQGFIFAGYYSEPDGAGTEYYDFAGNSTRKWTTDEDNITLYACWAEEETNNNHEYVKGVFDNNLRVTLFDTFRKDKRYTNNDFIGYVDKDVEYFLNK